jgi:DNA-binding protein H-NS
MQTYNQIQSQIAAVQSEANAKVLELQKQAANARKEAISNAIRDVKQLMMQYGLTIADLGNINTKAPKAKKAPSSDNRAAVAPKYRDNSTGETWTGRGKAPKWLSAKLASGSSKDQFLI